MNKCNLIVKAIILTAAAALLAISKPVNGRPLHSANKRLTDLSMDQISEYLKSETTVFRDGLDILSQISVRNQYVYMWTTNFNVVC